LVRQQVARKRTALSCSPAKRTPNQAIPYANSVMRCRTGDAEALKKVDRYANSVHALAVPVLVLLPQY
jgi:hypothetical protein